MKDLFSVENKKVLVTGGSGGIGLMIARGFVEHGAEVFIASRKAELLEQRASELSANGGRCVAIPADLSSEAACNALAAEVTDRWGEVDVLVNNAGANWGEAYETFPDSAWDRVLALNVKAVFQLTRALTPALAKAAAARPPARVINIGSIDGLKPPLLETYSYSASKAAVAHMSRVLARKLAEKQITVNCVAPGPFESKMMKATLDSFGEMIKKSCPLGRIGEPEDMAGIALFLASRAGAYVTGAVIPVDGGISTTT